MVRSPILLKKQDNRMSIGVGLQAIGKGGGGCPHIKINTGLTEINFANLSAISEI